MQTTQNPFSYGSPVEGAYFTDREEPRTALVAVMRNRQNALVLAPRRYGKTSLLKTVASEAREQGVRVGMARLMGCSTREQVAQRIATAISSEVMGWLPGHIQAFSKHLGAIRPGVELTLSPEGFKVGFSTGKPADKQWGEIVAALIRTLAKVSQDDRPVCLILDEFQRVAEINDGFAGVFKDLIDEVSGVSLVFAGSKAHLMELLTVGVGAPLAGVGQRITLGPIAEERMVPFLIERAAAGGKQLPKEVARSLYGLAHRVPNTIQQLAFWIFEEPDRILDQGALTRAIDRIIGLQEPEFIDRFERLGDVQQRVLLLLAGAEPGVPFRGMYNRDTLNGLNTTNQGAETAVKALLEKELVIEYREPGVRGSAWEVLDSLFARWLGQLN